MIIPKKALTAILVILVLAGAAYLVIKKYPGLLRAEHAAASVTASQETPPSEDKSKTEEIPLPVKTVKTIRGDLVLRLKSPGTAFADKKADLKAEVPGAVRKLSVDESRHVKIGEILAVLDDETYRLELKRAEAERLKNLSEMLLEKQFDGGGKELGPQVEAKIKASLEAFQKAVRDLAEGRIDRQEYDKISLEHETILIEAGMKKEEVRAAAKNLTSAEITVAKARMEVEKTKIRAPFAGIITKILISPGETISAGKELFTLVDIRRIRVVARVLESEVGRVKVGQEADLRFSAYPGRVFKGTIRAISPIIDEDKTCAVHIDIDNPTEEIKPGMHADVDIAADVFKDRLLVPHDAVLIRTGRKLVFVIEDGRAKWRYIESGLENDEYVEVLDGVKEGEEVIVEGHLTLAHDARVKASS